MTKRRLQLDKKPTSHTYEHNLDDYGYPFLPGPRGRLRKQAIKSSKSILGKCIYLVMSLLGVVLWLGRLGRKQPPLTQLSTHPRRILVIRLDLIGDLVLSMTVVRTLKCTYPGAEIDLLALPASSKVVHNDPDLAEIITYDPNVWRRPKALIQPKNWRDAYSLLRRLRACHYDIAVSVFGNWAGLLAVLSGAKRRVGFGRESYPGFMTDSVPGRHWSPGNRKHEVDYCLELAQAAGATITPADRVPRLYVDPQASQQLDQLLLKEGLQPGKPLIACHVSSNNGQSKRWPIPHWATLIDKLVREQDAQVVLTGASGDLPLIESVTRRTQEHAINLAGKTSLPQLVALLQRADLLISGDSGPMHIAAAAGTPLIAIHGPTDPAQSGPVSPTATILRSAIWCSPCYNAKDTADCRFYTTQCMKNILPAQVFEIVQEKLGDGLHHVTKREVSE
ncbi:MAG TPA: lipopolysaccharide heptosyltransferase II [Ktedonobacteraceae bacterium]|nr:lipopolysaccharide heptosyltransferase II [Ktedonobacteraceae bacterium]